MPESTTDEKKMKRLTIMLCALLGHPPYAHAAPALKLEDIKQIVCESTVTYDKDSPNEKTAARGCSSPVRART